MGALYNVKTHTINYRLKKIFADEELDGNSVIRNFRITAQDRKSYDTRSITFRRSLLLATEEISIAIHAASCSSPIDA